MANNTEADWLTLCDIGATLARTDIESPMRQRWRHLSGQASQLRPQPAVSPSYKRVAVSPYKPLFQCDSVWNWSPERSWNPWLNRGRHVYQTDDEIKFECWGECVICKLQLAVRWPKQMWLTCLLNRTLDIPEQSLFRVRALNERGLKAAMP